MRDVIPGKPSNGTMNGEHAAAQIRESLDGQFVCPFCGVVNSTPEGTCPRCSMDNTPAARKATKGRVGPWYVYQVKNPAAPGMKFDTLLAFVQKGRIKPRSIVRGPTTHQLWRFAAHVKGLSREFGVCYSCGGAIEQLSSICPYCKSLQGPPANPDLLLETVEPVPTRGTSTASRIVREVKEPEGPFSATDLGLPTIDDLVAEEAPRQKVQAEVLPVTAVAAKVAPAAVSTGAMPHVKMSAGKPRPPEDILSAKELANAFNLGFAPANGHKANTRTRHRQKPLRKARVVVVGLLVLSLIVTAVLFARPALRQRVTAMGKQAWDKVQPLFAKGAESKPSSGAVAKVESGPAPDPTTLIGTSTELKVPSPDLTRTATRQSPDVTTRPLAPNPASASRPLVAGGQTEKVVLPRANDKPPKTIVKPEVAVVKAPVIPPEAPPVEQGSASPPGNDETATADILERARALYNQGIDSEQHVDFVAAVKCYEQIMKLPHDAWPTDLVLRLRLARKQAEQK